MANGQPRKAEITLRADLTQLRGDVKKGEAEVNKLAAKGKQIVQQLRAQSARTSVLGAQFATFGKTLGRQVAGIAGFSIAAELLGQSETGGFAQSLTNIGVATAFGATGGPIMAAFAAAGATVSEIIGYLKRVDGEVAKLQEQFNTRDQFIKDLDKRIRDERTARDEAIERAEVRAFERARKRFKEEDYQTLLLMPGNATALPGDGEED